MAEISKLIENQVITAVNKEIMNLKCDKGTYSDGEQLSTLLMAWLDGIDGRIPRLFSIILNRQDAAEQVEYQKYLELKKKYER